MEQIVVQVKDKQKAKALFDLLTALDFVDSVKATDTEEREAQEGIQKDPSDFFSLAGLWQDREVTLSSIHQNA